MKKDVEYQIIVGCNDSFLKIEYVKDHELSDIIVDFFSRQNVNFSLLKINGGYLYDDGSFVLENGVCITIIGSSDEKILRLAKTFKMFMYQENVLVIKNKVETKII